MEKSNSPIQTAYAAISAVVGWFALIAQIVLYLENTKYPVSFTIVNYFSYFTILTNILCALSLTLIALNIRSGAGRFLTKPKSLTAAAVYITIVGLVYNVVLRSIWSPVGLQKIVDEILHSVIPVLFIMFWLIFVPKAGHQWKDLFKWLIYPTVYIVYTLARGSITGYYPYPFLEANKLGMQQIITNCTALIGVFVIFSLLYIAIARMLSKSKV